jgi:hypothetical protein
MKSGHPHLGTILVALQCGVWIALAPVVPQLHQASASHRHVFCLEHNRIEDDGLKQDRVLSSRTTPGTEAEIASTKAVPGGFGSRPACLFSNLVVQLSSAARSLSSTPVPLEERKIKAASRVDVPAAKIILFAPKHSPPEQRA